jgi:phosphate transport system permease protein
VARAGITAGGLGVIAAVLGILVYLVSVVTPLFLGASAGAPRVHAILTPADAPGTLFIEMDEHRMAGIALLASGEAVAYHAREGRTLSRRRVIPEGLAITACTTPDAQGRFAIGLSDGSVRPGTVTFETTFGAPEGAGASESVTQQAGGEVRSIRPRLEVADPLVPAGGPAVRLMDYRSEDAETRLALLTGDGRLQVLEAVRRRSLRRGSGEARLTSIEVPLPRPAGLSSEPSHLLLTSRGDQMYIAWPEGKALRYDLRDTSSPSVVERLDFVASSGARLTSLRFTLGEQSLLSADTRGEVRAWFRVPGPGGGDGSMLVTAHNFPGPDSPARAVAGSSRDKSFLTAFDDGTLLLRHITSERVLARMRIEPPGAPVAVRLAPKGDAALALTDDGRVTLWEVDSPHPEASWRALFGKVWYEGYPEAGFTWQSSSGTDDFEPKLSLIPLLFGTLKATFYAMLFAVPIALCAAIYTSEFLDRRARATLKPLIEMMASLPSVVLGFIAALVLAPLVESWAFATLCLFAVVPVTALTAGYAWELLPRSATLRLTGGMRLALLLALCAAAVAVTPRVASPLEGLLFGGDLRLWLAGGAGRGGTGVGLLAWPVIAAALLVIDQRRQARPRRGTRPWAHRAPARTFARYLLLLAVSVALACAVGWIASRLGIDPRGALVGSYVQRNALVVGFVMGFAVIPIVYTIAEDALSSVPQALRSASLGCGATPWQTAVRVVLPVGMSGIFSAVMVGLGRAVGETMIVLMAAGNTPVMDLNVFNGLRTLSANIAVELPEAVKDGTLYRILFLAALLLFVITFVVNTLAELVRQRFRKKAYQL